MTPFKVIGHRLSEALGGSLVVTRETGHALGMHLKRCSHSPTGFEQGYGGSGPAQLAFCILYEYYRWQGLAPEKAQELAWHHHQNFKWQFVARLGHAEAWEVTPDLIDGMGMGG